MTNHTCQALDFSDWVTFNYGPPDCGNPLQCCKAASIKATIGGKPVWLCASCYDAYITWIGCDDPYAP